MTFSPCNSDHLKFHVLGESKKLWAVCHVVTPFEEHSHIRILTFILLSFENTGFFSPVSFILTQYLSLAFNRESAPRVAMEGTIAILTSRVQWIQRTSGGFSMTVGTLFSACTFANTSCCDGEHFFLCFGLLIPY